ncbi:hypothetical protein [Cupriavidus agavae]|uniref:Glycine zipper family protein n=1 Tax=Cupriavidus agavae TaxID=1001822 RepID=A0A4Q7S336_9BURK|nr:hypothetical protein [Cupriavidus agavae]RZT39570.1 hypothetical protein EV147_2765 [Cupriavidus agavae]
MSTIIAGRFDTFARAETTATRLLAKGVRQDDLTMFYVNPPGQHGTYPIGGDEAVDPGARKAGKGAGRGIMIGAALGAGIGICLAAALRAWYEAPPQPWVLVLVVAFATGLGAYAGSLMGALSLTGGQRNARVRHAGVLLAAHVSNENTTLVANELRQNGAKDVERAEGQWRDGQWEDFDPLVPPVPVGR